MSKIGPLVYICFCAAKYASLPLIYVETEGRSWVHMLLFPIVGVFFQYFLAAGIEIFFVLNSIPLCSGSV